MALLTVIFQEHGGYTVRCRVRAAGQTPLDVIGLAVWKVWGTDACWVPFTDNTGCVWLAVGDEADAMIPKTGVTTVEVQPGTRRVRRSTTVNAP